MRSSKSRSRSKQNRNRSVGNALNRVFDSSGPEGKVRGTPQQIIEKYNQLARDAQLSNDRISAENFQQHAEHYLRILGEATREQDARREINERENKERQIERDRERPDRQTLVDGTDAAEDLFAGDVSESDQPDVPSMPATNDKPGLIETSKNNITESIAAPSDKQKSSRKSQDHRRRKSTKTVASADKASAESQEKNSTNDTSIADQSQETV